MVTAALLKYFFISRACNLILIGASVKNDGKFVNVKKSSHKNEFFNFDKFFPSSEYCAATDNIKDVKFHPCQIMSVSGEIC